MQSCYNQKYANLSSVSTERSQVNDKIDMINSLFEQMNLMKKHSKFPTQSSMETPQLQVPIMPTILEPVQKQEPRKLTEFQKYLQRKQRLNTEESVQSTVVIPITNRTPQRNVNAINKEIITHQSHTGKRRISHCKKVIEQAYENHIKKSKSPMKHANSTLSLVQSVLKNKLNSNSTRSMLTPDHSRRCLNSTIKKNYYCV